MLSFVSSLLQQLNSNIPRPGLHPIPDTVPLTVLAALAPPLIYYAALLLLAPFPPLALTPTSLVIVRNGLALIAALLFFRLPLGYHVSQSIGLTYQLGLVGVYGGCRVLDAFFISPYLFGNIPRRVRYQFSARPESHKHINASEKEWTDGGVKDPFLIPGEPNGHVPTSSHAHGEQPTHVSNQTSPDRRPSVMQQANDLLNKTITGPEPLPVCETAHTEEDWPSGWFDRASWALELELSMRGTGFTWTTADVRHTRETWLPTIQNRIHSISFHAMPVLLVCWVIIKSIYIRRLQKFEHLPWNERP